MRNYGSRAGFLILLTVAFGCAQSGKPDQSGENALRDQILAQERAGLEALKTGDLTAFAASTAENAVFVDAQGPATKAEVISHTAEFRLHDYTIADVRFVPVAADSGLIVYTLSETGASHGKEFSARVHVSSLWLKRGGKWMCAFSQETAAKQAAK